MIMEFSLHAVLTYGGLASYGLGLVSWGVGNGS